jgi:MYXO-CTERM domain-containing protein
VAWYGTVPRGNSNVYSRFEISYPGVAVDPCPTPPVPPPPPPSLAAETSRGCGCAVEGPGGGRSLLGALLLIGVLAARSWLLRPSARTGRDHAALR